MAAYVLHSVLHGEQGPPWPQGGKGSTQRWITLLQILPAEHEPQSIVPEHPFGLTPHSPDWQVSGVHGQAGQLIVPVCPPPAWQVQVPHRPLHGSERELHRPRSPPLPSQVPQS